MKKLILIFLITIIGFSCKKKSDDPIPETTNTGTQSCSTFDFTTSTNTYTPLSLVDGYYDQYDNTGTLTDIPIPFSFMLFGKSITHIKAQPDVNDLSFISPDIAIGESIYITYFMEFTSNPAYVSWMTDGVTGNRIMKIQFDSRHDGADDINFQIWLYESSNKIEVHYGKNNARTASAMLPLTIKYVVNASQTKGIALQGNVSSPKLYCLAGNDPDYPVTGSIPDGLTYIFTAKN